ncbi:MAG TPA: hypothetical protein VEJ47_05805 [Candidatus Eremiobacteraceae bacterium]|nr:hypothetical protein [Candidatus Eremiobacteraceae bacterium]
MERLALDWSIGPKKALTVTANGKAAELILRPGRAEVNGPLLVELPEPLNPGVDVELKIEFRNAYQTDFASEGRLLLQGWYPQLWWGFGTEDDYTVLIKVPQGWGVLTSGVFDPASDDWRGKDIRNFAVWMFDEKRYVVEYAQSGDVQISAAHTLAGAKCAKLVLQTAEDAVDFYRKRFGFYPHASLTIIPGMDYPAGGYPVATAMVAIHGQEQMDKKPEAHFRWITAHEIGHMYWSQYVLADGPDDLNWLMIGLGIFADREYRRARGITGPAGNLPVNYVSGMMNGIDTTMDLSSDQLDLIDWDYNNIVEHGKSSAMMDALESTIGAATFDGAYRRCLREFRGRRMNWHDFEKVCEEESGEDLRWFFESWVRTNQYSFYRITKHESTQTANGWRSEVEVVSQGTRLERVPVVATFKDRSEQRERTDRLAEASVLVFESKSPLLDVKLDPANTLWMPESERPLTEPDLERKILGMKLTGSGEQALQLLPRAKELHVAGSQAWLRLGLMLYDAQHYEESLDCFQKLSEVTQDKDYRFLGLAWQGLLLDRMGKRESAIAAYKAAQATGSQQWFRHDQYRLQIDQKWVQERLQTPYRPE